MKRWLFKIHGWIALAFALPLLVLIGTGLVLSLEPIAQRVSVKPGALKVEEVVALIRKHDPEGKARGLSWRAYDGVLSIDGVGGGSVRIDMATKAPAQRDGWSDVFNANRKIHEHLVIAGLDLTIASTIAMLSLVVLGILMGLPRIRNTIAGWHKAVSWFLLPLMLLVPITGLLIPAGITLNFTAAELPKSAPLPLAEAVQKIAASQDLSNLVWLRPRGGRQVARMWDGQEARVFAITKDGLVATPRNISRALHEGNMVGMWTGLANVIASLAFLTLTLTGVWMYAARHVRKFRNRAARAVPA